MGLNGNGAQNSYIGGTQSCIECPPCQVVGEYIQELVFICLPTTLNNGGLILVMPTLVCVLCRFIGVDLIRLNVNI